MSLSSQTTAVLERRRLDRSQSVVGVQQWKERQEDNDALRRKFVEDSIKNASVRRIVCSKYITATKFLEVYVILTDNAIDVQWNDNDACRFARLPVD